MLCFNSDLLQLQVVECRCRVAVSKKEELEARVADMEKDRRAMEKKCNSQQTKLSKLSTDLEEEKEVGWNWARHGQGVGKVMWHTSCNVLDKGA